MKKGKIKVFVSVLMIVLILFGYVPLSGAGMHTAHATSSWTAMSDQEFVRHLMGTSISARPFWDPDYQTRYDLYTRTKFTDTYPWATTTDAEFLYLVANHKIDTVSCEKNDSYVALRGRYDAEVDRKEAEEKRQELDKIWADSKLVGDESSHGMSFVKDPSVYLRYEGTGQYSTVYGKVIGGGKVVSEEPSGIGEMIMEFLCWIVFWLAEQLHGLLENGGIALDSVIFGRVAGYGIKLDSSAENFITMFGFELTNDNPYGYVAAILFQRLRSYIYIFMALFCLYKLIRIACKGDYEQMRMDAKTFAGNVVLAFGAIVMMPYILDLFLYVRDVILKGISYATLNDMFGTAGFLDSFKNAAELEKTNLIVNGIYLGAVVLSLFVAGIYVAYAMSMMVHFIFFPAVCLRGMSDNRAYGEWAKETLSLTIMPIVDGMILLIPLTFIRMANGNTAFNILSLIACGLLLTVRKQVKRTLNLQDNSALDNGAIATVMGLGMAAKGLANAGKKAVGKFAGGVKQAGELMQSAKEDEQMAEIQDMEAGIQETGRVTAPVNGATDAAASAGVSAGSDGYTRSDVASAKADMYRKRATQKQWKAMAKVVGGTAGAVTAVQYGAMGAALGAGAGAFLGPSAQMAAMGGGASAGASFGAVAGDLAGQTGVYMGKGVMAGAINLSNAVPDLGAMRRDAALAGAYSAALNNGAQFDASGEIWDQFAEYNAGEEWTGDVVSTVHPALEGKGTSVGASNVIDNETLEIFFTMNNGRNAKDYCSAAAGAVRKMEDQPGSLMHDDNFSEKINNVKEQINSLVSRARNGEDKDELLHGAGGLDELRNNFGSAKREKLAYDMSVNLNLMGAEYSPQSMLHRGALNSVVNHMATEASENKTPVLQESGRYMSADYDKSFNIFWKEAEDMIKNRGVEAQN